MAENGENLPAKPKRGAGRPFKPGVAANPGGRPKAVRDVAAAAREHTVKAIDTLVKALTAKTAPWNAKIRAAEVLLNRGYGQAPQTINLAGNVSTLTDDKLERAITSQLADYLAARSAGGFAGGPDGTADGTPSTPAAGEPDGVVH